MLHHTTKLDDPRAAAKRKLISHDGWRVGLTLLWIAGLCSMARVGDAALVGAPVLFAVLGAGLRPAFVLSRLLLMVPFGLAAILLLPAASGAHTWSLAVLLLIKLTYANLGITYILGTTPVPLFLRTLRRLKVPGLMVDLIGFTLRYISVLSEEARTMLTAQKARGLKPGAWAGIRSYRRTARLLGVLLERSLLRSRRIHLAMLSRGYDPERPQAPEWLLNPQAAEPYITKEAKPVGDGHPRRAPVVPVSGCDMGAS